jgi:solute carrier family 35 protein C2
MSIAGIAKEVSTILVSSWFFGDTITLLNAAGLSITVCGKWDCNLFGLELSRISGIGLFTHHKYRKSIESTVPLDAHGNPIIEDEQELAEERIPLTSSQDRG